MTRSHRSVWLWAVALGLLAAAVKHHALTGLDRWMAHVMDALRHPALDVAARTLTFFGSSLWLGLVLLVMGAWWWTRDDRKTLAVCLGAIGLGVAIQGLLRLLVAQWRPESGTLPHAADLMARLQLAGFPSGHAFRAAFLCGWWAEALPRRGSRWTKMSLAGLTLLAVAVGVTRVYLRRHWFSDVVGAWLLAMTVLAVAASWRTRVQEG